MAQAFYDGGLVLQFDLISGRNANAVVAGESLIAWVAAMREANAVLDPTTDVVVELVSADPACLRLIALIKFIERTFLDPPADALNETPRFKKLAVATVIGATGGLAAAGAGMLLLPDATVHIAPEERELHEEAETKVRNAPTVKAKVKAFWRTVEQDRNVSAVSVAESPDRQPLISVPRAEFAERGGLWDPEEPEPQTRSRSEVWDVIVTYPALFSEPRVWGFQRDGLPFTARVEDEMFLRAIHDGTLPIRIQEGVMMRVQVVWRERQDGQTWVVIPRSRKIARVLLPKS